MASRLLTPAMRMVSRPTTSLQTARSFQTSSRRLNDATVSLPARRPVGAFRGGMFGFLLGATVTGAGVYYYVMEEYKVSNELLTEDIYSLQASVQRVNTYVQTLEEKLTELEKEQK